MTTLLLERETDEVQLWEEDGGGATLDDRLSGAWEGLRAATSTTACPVCAGELVPRWSAGAGIVAGRCRECGSELS